jgi:hypothetical protein
MDRAARGKIIMKRRIKHPVLALVAVLVLAGVGLAAVGVLRMENSPDKTTITIDKKLLKEKTGDAIEKTKEAGGDLLKKAGDKLHNENKNPTENTEKGEHK